MNRTVSFDLPRQAVSPSDSLAFFIVKEFKSGFSNELSFFIQFVKFKGFTN